MSKNVVPLISVIVPVYNVEPYLARCIESVLAQTHSNMEVFLINDGSADESGAICDKFAQKDSRVHVIHQENAGVSSARNAGLDAARGQWVGFVDSDDWIEPDMYEKLLGEANNSGKDIVLCGYAIHSEYKKGYRNVVHPEFAKAIPRMEALEHIVRQHYIEGQIWNMFFNRNILETENPARFDVDVHGSDDRLFAVAAFLRSNGLSYLPEALYHFCPRSGSVTSTFNQRRLTLLLAYERILSLVSPVSESLARRARFNYMDVSIYLINRVVRSNQYVHLPLLRKAARRHSREYFFARDVSLSKKLRNASVMFFPRITNRIWAMLRKRYNVKKLVGRLNKR